MAIVTSRAGRGTSSCMLVPYRAFSIIELLSFAQGAHVASCISRCLPFLGNTDRSVERNSVSQRRCGYGHTDRYLCIDTKHSSPCAALKVGVLRRHLFRG